MSFKPTVEQEQIFNFFENGNGNGMIDAVAGSGKTSTIIKGIDYIDKKNKILFCAFNKKIQEEIDQKTFLKENVIVKTTYALGLRILKHHYEVISKALKPDNSKYYNILNDNLKKNKDGSRYLNETEFTDCFDTIRFQYYSNLKKDEPDTFYKTFYSNYYRLIDLLRYTLSYAKGEEAFQKVVEKYAIDIDSQETKVLNLYRKLVELAIDEGNKKAKYVGIYDFADMIFLPCEFKLRSPIQYDIIFVDECQDLSNAQLKTIRKHLKPNGRFFAVGDPFQSIYGFAGASPESFNNIKTIFTPQMFKLTNCFRCSREIVELAKEIRPDITTTNSCESFIKKIKFREIIKYIQKGDFVLSRHNCDLFEVVFELLNRGVKCKILGKKEILKSLKDIIPNDKIQSQKYYEDLPIHLDLIYQAAESKLGNNPANYEKLENLGDSIRILETCFFNNQDAKTLNDLFEYIESLMDCDDEDSIILSSIHRAKGLEAKNVFIIGYDNLPFKKEKMLDWQLYQERCLKYVAITRAEVNLYQTESPPENNNISLKDIVVENLDCELGDDIDNLPL
ncbi:ATP-dependent helicase [Flavobacterium sp.]|uniref:UvrD-helicase domain-containing protein n=1 Tax=Flavobacterium sp. TaxID=239 RepID=UPI0026151AC7|nr:ATP-dependent helicase [Flavobacterium sp.]